MARSLTQKLATLEGIQKQVDIYLKELQDNDLNYTMYRIKQELVGLQQEIKQITELMNALAHAVAISTDDNNLWINEVYRKWEQRLKGQFGDINN